MTNSCLFIEFSVRITSPNIPPLADASVGTSVDAGAVDGASEEERRTMTPEGAIKIPLMIGTALITFGVTLPVPCKPADENTSEPADSDMKQPRKYVLPNGPPEFAYGFVTKRPVDVSGSCSPTVQPAVLTEPAAEVEVRRRLPSPAPKTRR